METPILVQNSKVSGEGIDHQLSTPMLSLVESIDVISEKSLLEGLIEGILIVTEQQRLLYADKQALRIIDRLNQDASKHVTPIPKEIQHICQASIQSRSLFPNQSWTMEYHIVTNDLVTLHIRARWLKSEAIHDSCLLLSVEDRQQAIRDLVSEEANQYGLTPREKEVWILHRNKNYTYKQIASELGITPNTVKKHMRSIHAKKKLRAED